MQWQTLPHRGQAPSHIWFSTYQMDLHTSGGSAYIRQVCKRQAIPLSSHKALLWLPKNNHPEHLRGACLAGRTALVRCQP
ncbi:hypothetical protein DYL61_30140 [Pseudomonas nabeulensis]|uniref:Uncharacterized protein n=1 Tax=Pseudomonas nabeulensis TaxID=2293833 RepID=A0A4Z0AFB4_9PSED|nr:hypothetical protein DYL61_30140 [Pseudomonas nabeulensis]